MQISSRLEGDLGEVSPDGLFAKLKELAFKDNGVVLRIDGDADYWAVVVAVGKQIMAAQNGASLVGGVIRIWNATAVYPDGGGWRITLIPQELQVQLQGPPPSAGPRVKLA